MALLDLFFFGWTYLSHASYLQTTPTLTATLIGLLLLTLAITIISYVWIPKTHRTITILAAYILLGAATGLFIYLTGSLTSPFLALWMAVAVFGGIFGTSALAYLFVFTSLSMGWMFVNGQLTSTFFQGFMLAGYLPIIISYILWHSKIDEARGKEHAYYDLANELNQVSNKAEVVINAIGDGVIAIDNNGVIDLINPAAQRIVGWKREDALGIDYRSVLVLLGHDNHELPKERDPVFIVLTNNQQQRMNDLLLQTNSGKLISVSVVASPVGRMGAGAIVVFRDITKELAEEHEQAEFISTASHEMRTPVASIEGYLGLALNPATATIDAKAHDFITKAHESAQHLGRLFQDLLDVSKADDGRLSNNPKVINVVAFTEEIIADLKPKADAKNLHVFFKPLTSDNTDSETLPSLAPILYTHVDADHFREILSNLIENAIKYTPEGEVIVDVTGDESHVMVSISDSGIGIPAEDIPHLFQKFYRVDNSDTREIGGTGLGLYLCRKLAEAMSGRIWVESEYKKGSTFFVEVPRISHEEANRLIEASVSQPVVQKEDHHYLDGTAAPAIPQIIKHPSITTMHAKPAAAPGPVSTVAAVPPPQPMPQPIASAAPIPQATAAPPSPITPPVSGRPSPAAAPPSLAVPPRAIK